ncbi:MAG: acyltransferase [Verrucomicrobiota bacterium]
MISNELSKKLETIRGLAAFIVLLAHVAQWFIAPLIGGDHYAMQVMRLLAHFSVVIFFALSGYVITNSLVQNRKRNGYIDGFSFGVSRFVRICPPGIAACLFSLLVAFTILALNMHGSETFRTAHDLYVARDQITLKCGDVVSSFLLSCGVIQGTSPIVTNGPLWSLSIEFWIYFVALLGASALSNFMSADKSQRNSGFSLAIGAIMLLGIFAFRPFEIMQYLFYWMLGSLLLIKPQFPRLVRFAFFAVIFCGFFTLLMFAIKPAAKIDLVTGIGFPGLATISVKGTILLVLASLIPLMSHIPFLRCFALLAPSSYTLYVFHFPILCMLFSAIHIKYLSWSTLTKATFLIVTIIAIMVLCHYLAKILENRSAWHARLERVVGRVPSLMNLFHKRCEDLAD